MPDRVAWAIAVAALAACGSDRGIHLPAGEPAQFTVRGRWDDPRALRYRIESDRAPVDAAVWRRAVARALSAWQGTGIVGFVEAPADAVPDVTFCWRRGRHGACEPFGVSTAVAHSGPVASGTFVHFDADRAWSEDGSAGYSLYHTALHELGHVLGLGHSACPESLLRPDVTPDLRISGSELAGLQSLYGGGEDGEGDLAIVTDAGEVAAVLRRVAPPGVTDHDVFDTDGDGDDEVLVWRTDRKGNGALMVYHFGPGPKLAPTIGPVYGMSAPGASVAFARTPAEERLMICAFDGGKVYLRRFDERGLLVPRDTADLPAAFVEGVWADGRAIHRDRGDLDGDGKPERVVALR